jgi:hypothetical protein
VSDFIAHRTYLSGETVPSKSTVRARRAADVGDLSDGATLADVPADDSAFWDEVERAAVRLGGLPAGPLA